MKTHCAKRFLCILLSLMMAISLLPVSILAAGETSTWTKTAWDELTSDDVFAITMSKDGTTWALPTTCGGKNNQPLAEAGTVSGNTLTLNGGQSGFGWKKLAGDGGSFSLQTVNTAAVEKLYVTAANNGVRIGDPQNAAWAVFTFDGGYIKGTDSSGGARYIGVYNATDWRCYTSINSNITGQTLEFWKYEASGGAQDPEPTGDPQVTISTIAEALAGEANATFTVKGVVTLVDGKNVYVQDTTGGICLYFSAAPTDLALGDTVIGSGQRATYRGLPELSGAAYEKSSGLTLAAKDATIAALSTDDICTYVRLSGLTVSEVYDNNGAYASPNITFTDDAGGSIQLYKAVIGRDVAGAWAVKTGDKVNLCCAVGVNNTTLQLRNTLPSELTVLGGEPQPGAVAAPVPDVEPGEVENGTLVTFTSATEGAVVMLSLDGESWQNTDCSFILEDCTIYAKAVLDEVESETVSYAYTLRKDAPALLDKLTEAFADGTRLVIYHPASGTVMTTEQSGKKLVGAAAEFEGEQLRLTEGMAYMTVLVTDGGLLFQRNDSYLTSEPTGNGVGFQPASNSDLALWTPEQQTDGTWYLMNVGAAYNEVHNQALEYYNGFTTYGRKDDNAAYKFDFYGAAVNSDPVSGLKTGDKIAILNDGNGKAVTAEASGTKLKAADAALNNKGELTGDGIAEFTVTVNDDGQLMFVNDGKYLTSGATGNSLTLAAESNDYSLWVAESAGEEGLFFLKNANAAYNGNPQYLEYYNTFTVYGKGASANSANYAMSFRPLAAQTPGPQTELEDGAEVVIYNAAAGGSLGVEDSGLNASLSSVATVIEDGVAYPENGAYVFTVGVVTGADKVYYTFQTGGKYLTTDNTEALYLQEELGNTGMWYLTARGDGYILYNREANYNGTPVCIEFFSGAFSGWTFKAADANIFIMEFYPLAEGVTVLNGAVNNAQVIFTGEDSVVKQAEYKGGFLLDDLTPVEEITSVTATCNGEPIELTQNGKSFSFTIPGTVTAEAETLTIAVSVTRADGESYGGTQYVSVNDVPLFEDLSPAPGSETGDDLMPTISAAVKNAPDGSTVEMSVGGKSVEATLSNGVVTYRPAEPLKEGRTTVKLTVTRTDGATNSKTWSFTVGVAREQLYFGQLHAHTAEYSDGAGTLADALNYIQNLPESANVQFVAFTDHSNYFDSSSSANPEGALYDMSLASAESQAKWNSYNVATDEFNESQTDVVAITGFEMTWSGGPGHINTFRTPGIVSRNNSTLNNKTADAGMKAYYALLSQAEGANSVSQFNHPGKTFGNFSDFNYWDPVIDSRMYLVEVGNGEGQIGAGGYYPSYEQYTMALDKGWHVAPTNNQDNHKGKWGNANDARDVILTDDFSEDGLLNAIQLLRVYATEDKNLEIYYNVNSLPLGSQITEVPETLEFNVQVSDPDSADTITKVELIVNSGKTAYTWDDPAELATGTLTATLAPDYSYYYVRVTEGDKDLAVTAPVWVGETLKLGISAVDCGTAMPVTNEELTLTTTLFNSEVSEAAVTSVIYTTNGSVVLGTDTTGYTVPASGMLEIPFPYTPTVAKVMTVTVTVVMVQDGKEFTFTKDVELDVQDADKLVYIGIDASHYNEYVAGYYKDSMGNFAQVATGYAIRTVYLDSSEALIAACSNEKYKALIFTAPSRRLAAAQSDPKTYSADELAAIAAFHDAGGLVIVCGWGDAYENYSVITGNPDVKHMAETQNELLAALGSAIRLGDDEVVDPELNGGQEQRLYLSTYNFDSFLMDRVEFDPDHPNDNLYTERYSNYGGSSVYFTGDGVPENVTPVVYGHVTTDIANKDNDNNPQGIKYPYTDDTDRAVVLATEEQAGKGLVIVSGAAFMSNFEVQVTVEDTNAEKNYSNYKICENLLATLNQAEISTIAEVRAQTEEGFKYTIEGVVTSNASGFDKDTAFFDCIYVQDETAGICCFPVAGNFQIGDAVRITGTTDWYQGEPELQVISITKIGAADPVEPTAITSSQLSSREVEGLLVTLTGSVESFELENGLVQTIMVKDAAGNVGRVFIDGYITTGSEVEGLTVGCAVSATGLASYDDTFNAPEGPFPRIRVRNRADVVCSESVQSPRIVTAPESWTGAVGEYPAITVVAEGEGPLSYQWYWRNFGQTKWNVSSDKDDSYDSYPLNDYRNGRSVYCVITDVNGNTVSTEPVTMSVRVPEGHNGPVITAQPVDWYGLWNEYPSISVTAEGERLRYQWYYRDKGETKWHASSDKDNSYDSFKLTTARDGREVYCVVTDAYLFQVSSETATMNFGLENGYTGPTITEQPQSWVGLLGEYPEIRIVAEGEELSYKWYYRDAGTKKWKLSSETDDCYDSYPLDLTRAGREVYCVVTDAYGLKVKSEIATMDFNVPEGHNGPVITAQPQSWTGAKGEYPSITVVVEGEGLSYQWYWMNANQTRWNLSSDKDESYDSYVLNDYRNGRSVYCVITDQYGFQIASDVATMSEAQ
ncbi:MAG: CehA/McbA family metallohydrolase [Oscillospiraceae bacterium]|nr:CehA/McbA family metallohydrolase [Oscillospiraceae bacterium]